MLLYFQQFNLIFNPSGTITARHPLATYKPSFLGCRKRVHLTGLNRRQIKKAKIEQIKV